jgi:hypothetical protein
MNDPHQFESFEDEAALYVMGQLGMSERRSFEARLSKSAELRALLRELEAGMMATAVASPQRPAPPQVWGRIEAVVSQDAGPGRLSFHSLAWLRSGWATAACLLGWLLYACWVNFSDRMVPPPVAAPAHSSPAATTSTAQSGQPADPEHLAPAASQVAVGQEPLSSAALREIAGLRGRVADLQDEVGRLSETVARQQAVLSQSSHVRFFELVPHPSDDGMNAAPPPPLLRRAILVALAHELGWLEETSPKDEAEAKAQQLVLEPGSAVDILDLTGADPGQVATVFAGSGPGPAEMVDEPPLDSSVAGNPPQFAGAPAIPVSGQHLAFNSHAAIPAFISPDANGQSNLMLALPAGEGFTLWNAGPHGFEAMNTFTTGANPMVVIMPYTGSFTAGLPDVAITPEGVPGSWLPATSTPP